MRRISSITLCALAASACSGPKGETPVDLQPGRYEIQFGAGGPLGGKSGKDSLCVPPDRAATFTDSPLRGLIFESTSGCTVDKKRQGNAFSGSYSCSVDGGAEFGSQGIKATYDGSLKSDSFSIDGQIEVTATQGGGRRSFSVTGKRSGDC